MNIEIAVNEGWKFRKIKIDAIAIDSGFAIHESINGESWTVTHIKSGFACGSVDTIQKAQNKLKLLKKLSVNDVLFADMEICEALALWPVLYQQYATLAKKKVSEEKLNAGMENAAWQADFISCAR